MLSVGQVVDRYVVEGLIGQGGMALVYRARHQQLGSLHALKLMNLPKPQLRERLLQEGRAQAVIRHPNVVSVSDILEIEGTLALVMEYVEGPSLEVFLKRNRPTLSEVDILFQGICQGVAVAHARGLVHRDLKPANVLLAPIPGGGFPWLPKVTDFGIAKLLDSDLEEETRTNMAMGTPHYMAPEQIRDAKRVDTRADIFSLGCVLYELVCGTKAFDGSDVLEVLNAVATGKYISPRRWVPDLPDRYIAALKGALRIDRDNRIPDCSQLLSVFLAERGGEPTFALESRSEFESTSERATPAIVSSNEWGQADPRADTVPAASRQTRVVTPPAPRKTSWKGVGGAVLLWLCAVLFWAAWRPRPLSSSPPSAAVMGIAPEAPELQIPSPPPQPVVPDEEPRVSMRMEKPAPKGLGLFGSEPPSAKVEMVGARKSVLIARGIQVPFGTVAPGRYLARAWVSGVKEPFELIVDAEAGSVVTIECATTGCVIKP